MGPLPEGAAPDLGQGFLGAPALEGRDAAGRLAAGAGAEGISMYWMGRWITLRALQGFFPDLGAAAGALLTWIGVGMLALRGAALGREAAGMTLGAGET